ncbi:MAG TPA: hypothetical protein VNF71_08625 [Acidimicrobiales bacterium]|nr:hypothetical protein [Acidimicrobiales bacterium]
MQIQDIPRAYVRTTLRAIRMPIDLSESIARRNGDDRRPWPPAVVFDAVQGGIKKAIGSLLRDERLVEEGKLNQAAAKEQRQALLLGAVADSRRERAEERFEERSEQVAKARNATHARAGTEKKTAERVAGAKRRSLESKAEKLAEDDARLDAVAQESLARKERASRARQIETERRAIAKERRAVASEAAVADLDAEIEASKQARQSD